MSITQKTSTVVWHIPKILLNRKVTKEISTPNYNDSSENDGKLFVLEQLIVQLVYHYYKYKIIIRIVSARE